MPENLQDKLISDYDYKEYDISYPVIITRWEIMQVNGLEKRYLQVYFQKISDTAKAFKFNVKCYSDFGEIENLSDISLQEADKMGLEFSKVVPLKSEVNEVEIIINQCLLIDNSLVEPKGKQIAVNTFKLFNKEDSEAGKMLLPNAKGLPIDNVSHWYCACGKLHNSYSQSCLNCHRSKKEIFSLFTCDNFEKARKEKVYDSQKNKVKRIVMGAFVFVLGLIALISLFFPILKVSEENIIINGFNTDYDLLNSNNISLTSNWTLLIIFSLVQLIFSIATMAVGILTMFFFSDKKAIKILIGFSVACGILVLIYMIIGSLIYNSNQYLEVSRYTTGKREYRFSEYLPNSLSSWQECYNVKSLYWLGFVLYCLIYIGFIISFFGYNRIYNYFNSKNNNGKIQ